MSVISLRLIPIVFGGLLVAVVPASAQTTINLHTANGNCVAATSDPAGLTLTTTPGSTALQANGVSLTAQQTGACNPVGGASSDFQVAVVTSGSATPGTPYTPAITAPFYVIWSAAADAVTCTRGGNFTSGMSGWTPGSKATCSGTCAGTHAEQVTPTAAGNYNFSVTCTNASGYAATSTLNVPQPATPAPTPNPIPLTAPSQATAGLAFAVTWPQMQNAARCVGTGTLGGTPVAALGDWTTLTTVSNTAANSRNVVVAAGSTGALVLTLTCWNSDNSASAIGASSSINVVPGTAGQCPATITTATDGTRTLLGLSDVQYTLFNTVRHGVVLTEWDNVWGYNNNTATSPVPWPGVTGSEPRILAFKRDSYVGIHFKTPAAPQAGLAGTFINSASAGGPNLTMAISTACGDFSANLPTPGCVKANIPSADSLLSYWNFGGGNPAGVCNLAPNTDYYVNMMMTDKASTVECAASSQVCPPSPWRGG
jgi:hypothetical protein